MDSRTSFFNDMACIWDEAVKYDKDKLRHFIALSGMRENDVVLDVGSGTGVLVPYIREINKLGQITELDASSKMLNMARAKYYNDTAIRYLECDIACYNEVTEYDRIFFYGVLPHLKDKIAPVVNLFRNNLKGGGSILISHACGMTRLNALHSKGDVRISGDILPHPSVLVKEYAKNGLNVVLVESNISDYTILLK